MYQLDAPFFFYGLGILPILWIAYFLMMWVETSSTKPICPFCLDGKVEPQSFKFQTGFKIIYVFTWNFFFDPGSCESQNWNSTRDSKKEGVDIVFAIDVSKSMLAEDIAPNRLEKSKRLASAIINQLASDRIGIIAYAAQAIPQLPITTDYGAAKMFFKP